MRGLYLETGANFVIPETSRKSQTQCSFTSMCNFSCSYWYMRAIIDFGIHILKSSILDNH